MFCNKTESVTVHLALFSCLLFQCLWKGSNLQHTIFLQNNPLSVLHPTPKQLYSLCVSLHCISFSRSFSLSCSSNSSIESSSPSLCQRKYRFGWWLLPAGWTAQTSPQKHALPRCPGLELHLSHIWSPSWAPFLQKLPHMWQPSVSAYENYHNSTRTTPSQKNAQYTVKQQSDTPKWLILYRTCHNQSQFGMHATWWPRG